MFSISNSASTSISMSSNICSAILSKIFEGNIEWQVDTRVAYGDCKVHFHMRSPSEKETSQRWSLTFEWSGGEKATYEAKKNNKGELTPGCKLNEVKDAVIWSFTSNAKSCSPKQVNSKARTLCVGDMMYTELSTNGQEWARALARYFGVQLPPGHAQMMKSPIPKILFTKEEWQHETDATERSCKILLTRRYLGLMVAYHWALTFEWEGGYRATYEALEEGGFVTPRWKQGDAEEVSDDGVPYKWELYDTYPAKNCSPSDVNSRARSCDGVKYDVLIFNCQGWARYLAVEFGVDLPLPASDILARPLAALGLGDKIASLLTNN